MATPTPLDSYSRYMAEMFDAAELYQVSTAWQQFFTNGQTLFTPDSEVVDIDISKANDKIAKMIPRGTNSEFLNLQKNIVTENYSSFARRYPLAEEVGNINASQLNKRVMGEAPTEGKAKIDRARYHARKIHLEQIRRYARLFEVLAGLSVIAGQMPAILGSTNADDWYDFRRPSTHIVTPTVKWDVSGEAMLNDIDNAITTMGQKHCKPDMAIFGGNVTSTFVLDTLVQQLADIRGYSLIMVGQGLTIPSKFQRFIDAGMTVFGKLTTPRGRVLYLFTYDAQYQDDDGTYSDLMPLNSCVLAQSDARCDRYFGPSELLPLVPSDFAWYQEMFGFSAFAPPMPMNIKAGSVIDPRMFYFDAYKSGDNKKVSIRTQTAPIFATTQTDAFFTFYGCLTITS